MEILKLKKILLALKARPSYFFALVRQTTLFITTKLLWPLLGSTGITLGNNVRIQRLRCLQTDGLPSSSISVGANSIIYEDAKIESYAGAQVLIGDDAVIGRTKIVSRGQISIGKRFLSSWDVFIQDFDPHPTDPEVRALQVSNITAGMFPSYAQSPRQQQSLGDWKFPVEAISIGDDVWLGAGVTILKGAKIGSGSIVGANAVVTRGEYPERSLIAGNPAKVIKSL